MSITIDPSDVREAGRLDEDDHPDESLVFPTELAQEIVNDELAPHSSATRRLEMTAALLGAAYVVEDTGPVEQASQESADFAFDTEQALTLFRQAKQADPTGRLGETEKPTASITVPRTRGRE